MDYEQKYKEALEKLQEALAPTEDGCEISGLTRGCLENIFPELKENDDEKIRKELIEFLKLPHSQFVGNREHEKWIAWLEKQGEKRPIENVEKRFREGDKIVSNQDGKVYTVGTEYYVRGDNICLHDTDGNYKWVNRKDLNKNYHLWTSEDAKKLNADEVIAWLVANIRDYEYFVKWFKKDFGL